MLYTGRLSLSAPLVCLPGVRTLKSEGTSPGHTGALRHRAQAGKIAVRINFLM